MSTTFGVQKDNKNIELVDDCVPEDILTEDDVFIEVAFRGNRGFYWKNDIARFLPHETRVYPLDNSAQGIYTIGDIIKAIENENKRL